MKRFGYKEIEGCEYLKRPPLNEIDRKLINELYFLTFFYLSLCWATLQFRLLDLRASFTIKHRSMM